MLAACVAAYVALFVAAGLWASRRVRNAADYAVARGGFGTAIVAATVFTTWFGAETVLGIPAVFLKEGVSGLAADPFAAVGCLVLVALVFARPLFRLPGLTLGDFFRERFDRRTEVLLSACIAFSYVGWIAAQLVALGVAFNAISGGAIAVPAGIVIGAAIVLAYTLWGGMWSVAVTDFVQAIVIVVGLGYVAWAVADAAGGAARVFEAAAAGGRLAFAWPTDPAGILSLAASASVVLLGSVPQQDVLQRVKSARDEGTAVRGTLAGGAIYFAIACVPMFLVAAATLVDPARVAALLDKDAQLILPALVLERTPLAVQALFFGALLSAIFSTASGALLAPAVIIAQNLVRPLRGASDRSALRVMRLTVLALAVAVTAMALLSSQSIYQLVNNSGKVVLATSFVPLAAGLFWRRATARGAWWSACAGLAAWLAAEWWAPGAVVPPVFAGLAASVVGMAAGATSPPSSGTAIMRPPNRPGATMPTSRIPHFPLSLCVLAASLAAALPTASRAQQARERIEVTGSNIKRTEAESALPVTIIGREDIERSGAATAEDILRHITANTAMMSDTNQGVGYAVSTANLRGIGASSTLVLLNGRRLANHPFGSIGGFGGTPSAVDLNSIPFGAIERVEVLRDGASAVYGTDAVGGVINFITRSDFRGGEISLRYGNTEAGVGGRETGANIAFGAGDLAKDRWNALVTGHFEYSQRVKAIDQKLYARARDIEGATFPTSFRAFPGRLMDFGFSPGAYAGTLTNNPSFASCDPDFTVLQTSGRTPSGDPRMRCRGIYAAFLDNLPDTHKADLFGRFAYQVSNAHEFFAEASYAVNHNIGRIAPVPIDQTAAHIRPDGTQPNILLPITSRYAPIDLIRRLGYNPANTGTPGFLEIAVRSVPAGNRINDNTNEQSRFSAGFKGVFSGWDYDTALTWARANGKLAVTGYIQEQRFIDALRTGNLNPFGPNDAAGEALLRGAMMEGDMRKSKSTITQVDGKASRDLFAMSGGNAALAVGADVRREEIDDRAVNADYGAGLHIGGEGTVPNTNASRNVYAVFGEISLPVVRNVEVTGAVRYDHYSDVGSKTSPMVRARWNPVREVLLRASAGRGFRAPSLWDLHSPPSFGNSANAVTDPGCPAALLADEDPRCVDTQLNVRNISSPSLKPETSSQWSLGAVLEPRQGLSLGIDYWRIEKKDQIGTITADTILANPNDLTLYNRFINRFVRSPVGTTLYVDQPLENLGDLRTAGWDVDARTRFDTSVARFGVSFTGTYMTEWKLQAGKDFPFVSYLGNSFYGGNAYPRWTHVARIDAQRGPWLGVVEQTFTSGWAEAFQAGGTHELPSISRINLLVKYSGFRNTSLLLGVKNALDQLPPYTDVSSNGSHAAGWANSSASPLGRFWYGVVTYSFK